MDPSLAPLSAHLGAITARLAALEAAAGITPPAGAGAMAAAGGGGGGGGGAGAQPDPDSPAIAGWKEFMKSVDAAATAADGAVDGLGGVIRDAFAVANKVVLASGKYKKPKGPVMIELFATPFKAVVTDFKGKMDRRSDDFNHQSSVSEGLNAVQWVAVDMAPVGLIESFLDGATFYLNKVRREHKGVDKHTGFCTAFTKMMKDLMAYVKEHHKTGLSWNFKGKALESAGDVEVSDTVGPEETTPAAPPAAPAAPPAMDALFAEVRKVQDRQKGGKTAGLRHVSKDMKSKNAGGTVSVAGAPKPKPAGERKTAEVKRRPTKFEKVQRRYFVENHFEQKEPLQIDDVTMRDEVVFYNNENLTLIVNKKIKAISIDKCKKCQIILESCLSSVEIINCKSVKLQVKGTAPSIAIDKTDGCIIYQSLANIDAQISVSKISECNISWPASDDPEAEWIEKPIPEQFVATVVDGQVKVEVSELYSS